MNQSEDYRIPTTVLTGFLGSGKTTLLNYILKENHNKKIAVIENEFGEIGIDDSIVKIDTEEEIFEMNNGCICCTVRGDLIRILGALAKKKNKFDMILIETTGLADPAPVCQTFFVDPDVCQHFYLDAVVTMVDAKHILMHLDEEKPIVDPETGEQAENEALEQIAFADRLIINKTDLVTKDEVELVKKRVRDINKLALIYESQQSRVNLDDILDVKGFSLSRILEMDPNFLEESEHQHDQTVTSVGFSHVGYINRENFETWIRKVLVEKGTDIFRSKGILYFKDATQKYVFQGVHMLMAGSEEGGEINQNDPLENKIVFIGRNLDRAYLRSAFLSCKA